jgi:hypothetical protein
MKDVLLAARWNTQNESEPTETWFGLVVGLFLGFDSEGAPLVDFPGNPTGTTVRARVIGAISKQDCGKAAALLFQEGDPAQPIIVGVIQDRVDKPQPVGVEIDNQILEFKAEKQIVLRCGDASITLTRAGKVLIRGKYILSNSLGVNMVKGGIIRLN